MNKKNLFTIATSMFLSGMLVGNALGRTGGNLIRSDVANPLLVATFLTIGFALLMYTGFQIDKWFQFWDHVFKSGGSSAELSKPTEDELVHDH